MIKQAIEKIVDKQELSFDEAYAVMKEVMTGETSPVQNAAFLAALSTKRATTETVGEISGCVKAIRDHAVKVEHGKQVMEIGGTGGDGSSSFNISTTTAFVVAAAGVKVAKHGNRAESSKSGTADCLEALGANISIGPDQCSRLLDQVGFCFLYAQKYHTAIKYVAEVRKELGSRTVFNILGALTNPACPSYYLLGVYDEYLVEPLAKVLTNLNVKKAMVVYGKNKMDEISLSAPTTVCEIKDGYYKSYVIRPEDFGFRRCSKEELVGGTPDVNAQITRSVLSGKERGPKRNIVLLNAGAALYAAGRVESIAEGIELAQECIDNQEAAKRMEDFIALSWK